MGYIMDVMFWGKNSEFYLCKYLGCNCLEEYRRVRLEFIV